MVATSAHAVGFLERKNMKIFKYNIDINSFFKVAPKKINENFGVSLITGYQGSGKTYFAVYLLVKKLNPKLKIYTNIKSLAIPKRDVIYFEKIDEIVYNTEKNCVFVFDEISKRYTKDCKQDRLFYSWLQQCRKNRRYVLLITQEYLQVPVWLRGVARYVYTTNKIPLLPLFITYHGYAVLNEDLEWVVDTIDAYIYKRNKSITKLYDTLEPVQVL